MKAKLYFYSHNILDGIRIAMNESMKQNYSVIQNNKKTILMMLFLLAQFSLALAQPSDDGTSTGKAFATYAGPLYGILSVIIAIVLVYSNFHTIVKGINGDTEAWKKLGGAGAWIVVWFVVVPFLYKIFMGKATSGTNQLTY